MLCSKRIPKQKISTKERTAFRMIVIKMAKSHTCFIISFLMKYRIRRNLTLSYLGGIGPTSCFFLHHLKTAHGIKLNLSDFKDSPLRYLLQAKPVGYCNGNKKYQQYLASKKSEKSAICKEIELKFGIETNFEQLSSKIDINLQFDVIKTPL